MLKKCAKKEKGDFHKRFECAAPNRWSKFTTEGDIGGKKDPFLKIYKQSFFKHAG